jgi:Family of unknown function (DUF5947)
VSGKPFTSLRRLTRDAQAAEQCDLCSTPLRDRHRHLVEPAKRQVLCACDACAILFEGQSERRYRLVPDRVLYLEAFQMPDELWDSLLIPVNMAFFFKSTPEGRVVPLYPGPAGATESLLELESWQELEAANPILRDLQPDVEALLVNRVGTTRDHYLVPIDRGYQLVGLIRSNWRGLSGGTEVWRAINGFFSDLRASARTVGPPAAGNA